MIRKELGQSLEEPPNPKEVLIGECRGELMLITSTHCLG
jgi:hypothetical protein